jgi:hypothetical protein
VRIFDVIFSMLRKILRRNRDGQLMLFNGDDELEFRKLASA